MTLARTTSAAAPVSMASCALVASGCASITPSANMVNVPRADCPSRRPDKASDATISSSNKTKASANNIPPKGCGGRTVRPDTGMRAGHIAGVKTAPVCKTLRARLRSPDWYNPGSRSGRVAPSISSGPATPGMAPASRKMPKPFITCNGVHVVPFKSSASGRRADDEMDSRSSISTNKPDSGSVDHSALAVT